MPDKCVTCEEDIIQHSCSPSSYLGIRWDKKRMAINWRSSLVDASSVIIYSGCFSFYRNSRYYKVLCLCRRLLTFNSSRFSSNLNVTRLHKRCCKIACSTGNILEFLDKWWSEYGVHAACWLGPRRLPSSLCFFPNISGPGEARQSARTSSYTFSFIAYLTVEIAGCNCFCAVVVKVLQTVKAWSFVNL